VADDTIYRLSLRDLDALRELGVCAPVLRFMRRILFLTGGPIMLNELQLKDLRDAQREFAEKDPPAGDILTALARYTRRLPASLLAACGKQGEDLPRLGYYAGLFLLNEEVKEELRLRRAGHAKPSSGA